MRIIPKSERLFIGQQRTITKFLIFPKKLKGEIRWLERVEIKQKVINVDVGGSMEWGNYKNKWVSFGWNN